MDKRYWQPLPSALQVSDDCVWQRSIELLWLQQPLVQMLRQCYPTVPLHKVFAIKFMSA